VSASTSAAVRHRLPLKPRRGVRTSPSVLWFVGVTIAVDLAILVAGSIGGVDQFEAAGWDLVAWTVCVAILGLASIQTDSGLQLGMDMPVLLAAGFLYGPIVAGVVAFVAFADIREIRGGISVSRALFNRAQTSLSVILATAVFVLVGSELRELPLAAVGALLAVGVDAITNYALVVAVLVLNERSPVRACMRRLWIGRLGDFAVTYLSFGLLSLLLAQVHAAIGSWGLVLFTLPIVLARKALSGSQQLHGAERRIRVQAHAVRESAERIFDARRDERLAVAAGLHDEVLPPLFKVHLMGKVISQDLASGRLLDLEDDMPELLRATDEASNVTRALIRSLRSSPLGSHGLAQMLHLLVREVERDVQFGPRIELDVEECGGSPLIQLLAYQIAREALRNAVRHARARTVRLSLHEDGRDLRLTVEDDGEGFEPGTVDEERHFGLSLMRERVDLAGGLLHLDTCRGDGTRIVVRLPSGRTDAADGAKE